MAGTMRGAQVVKHASDGNMIHIDFRRNAAAVLL
jgi:hypothetical protein